MLLFENLKYEFTTIQVLVLFLYGGFLILLLMFGWDLLGRYTKADKRMRGDPAYLIFFIIAVAMMGYGIYIVPATINYFFFTDTPPPVYLVTIQYSLILLIIMPIAYVCLSILFKKKKIIANVVSSVGILGTLYIIVITILTMVNPDNFTLSMLVWNGTYIFPVIILIGIYGLIDFFGIIFILVVKLSPQKKVRNKVLLGLLGIVIAGMGLYIEITKRSEDNWWYVNGTIVELIGFIIMRFFFLSIPSYDEFDWKSGMIELHVIMAETGISLHYHKFRGITKGELKGDLEVTVKIPEDESRPNTDLVAGGLIGIKGMLSEISGDKGKLQNIQIGEKTLAFKQGSVVLCLLLCENNLGVYYTILADLVQEIEKTHPSLANFNGDTRKLHIKPIVDSAFDVESKKSS